MNGPDSTAPPQGIGAWALLPAAYLVLVCFVMHFVNVNLLGYDPYFHARYSSELPGRLFDRTFPAAAYSVWSDTWGDKEFLFHLFLMPFVQIESLMIEGTKLAGLTLNLAFLGSMAWVMRRQGIVTPVLWLALLLAMSSPWWVRFTEVRGQLASLVFFPWILYCFERRRMVPLAVLTFLFTWTYTAPFFAFVLVACMAVGRALVRLVRPDVEPSSQGPGDGRLVLAALGATVLGIAIHPHTPNVQITTWIHLRLVLATAWGLESDSGINLAGEFASSEMRRSVFMNPGLYIVLAAAWFLAAVGKRNLTERGAVMLFMTLPLFGLYALSQRFVEYLAPMALWALGAVVTDQLAGRSLSAAIPSAPRRQTILGIAVAAAVALHVYTIRYPLSVITSQQWGFNQASAGAWLRDNVPEGTLVVPLAWGQVPQLYFHAPHLRYPVMMDPMLMYARHPEESKFLNALLFRTIPFSLEAVSENFPEAQYFIACATQGGDFRRMDAAGYTPVYDDGNVRIYRLGGEES